MPADNGNRGPMSAIKRLMRLLSSWRQRRAVRRRTRLHGFMGLSDRTLADIGLCRADVHAAMIGVMPLGRRAIDHSPPPRAKICQLPGRPGLTVVTDDLSAAA